MYINVLHNAKRYSNLSIERVLVAGIEIFNSHRIKRMSWELVGFFKACLLENNIKSPRRTEYVLISLLGSCPRRLIFYSNIS